MFVIIFVKPFNISKFMIIDLTLFSKVRLFELKQISETFLSCSYTLLCRLILTVQEKNKVEN